MLCKMYTNLKALSWSKNIYGFDLFSVAPPYLVILSLKLSTRHDNYAFFNNYGKVAVYTTFHYSQVIWRRTLPSSVNTIISIVAKDKEDLKESTNCIITVSICIYMFQEEITCTIREGQKLLKRKKKLSLKWNFQWIGKLARKTHNKKNKLYKTGIDMYVKIYF